ncbi:MAG: helix-turn-helix domain-containing protein [Clostridiales bacterium]|nr:helix-turn-helix domain-containing protein [Clostridiales bacterium]
MEAKTIGKFIAVLRKANGMTQKDLAEKLNVSDKAVSRWERDESLPDLTLIPVIAELFGVTTDELLRGERNPAGEPAGAARPAPSPARTEKQIARILSDGKTKLLTRSMLSVGLSLAGLLGAMVMNFGFNRAYVGFFVGCLFYVAALLCEAVFCILAQAGTDGEEFQGEALNSFRRFLLRTAKAVMGLAVVLLGATVPLIAIPYDTYQGILGITWLAYGLLFGLLAAVLWGILTIVVSRTAEKRGFYHISEAEATRRTNLWKARGKTLGVTALVMALTLVGQLMFDENASAERLVQGTVFTDFESFQTYMATEPEQSDEVWDENSTVGPVESDIVRIQDDEAAAENGDGTGEEDSTEEETYLADLEGPDGTALEFEWRNTDVWSVSTSGEGDNWTVRVLTVEDFTEASRIHTVVSNIFSVAYVVELAAGLLWYRHELKKRKLS